MADQGGPVAVAPINPALTGLYVSFVVHLPGGVSFNRPAAASAHPTLVPTAEPAFQPREVSSGSTLADLALLTEEEFRQQFKGSPVKRAKWRGLMRNVAAALAVSDDPEAGPALDKAAANDSEPPARERVQWV